MSAYVSEPYCFQWQHVTKEHDDMLEFLYSIIVYSKTKQKKAWPTKTADSWEVSKYNPLYDHVSWKIDYKESTFIVYQIAIVLFSLSP